MVSACLRLEAKRADPTPVIPVMNIRMMIMIAGSDLVSWLGLHIVVVHLHE